MKTLYTYLLLALCLTSCHPEEDLFYQEHHAVPLIENRSVQRGVDLPANSSNAYDAAGRLYNEIFEAYYSSAPLPGTIDSIALRAESIGTNNAEFQALKGSSYAAVSTTEVAALIANSNTCVADVIAASSLSSQAKVSLHDFIYDVVDVDSTEEDYEVVYNFITSYEDAILQNGQLTQGDKKIILTTTSIARYTIHMRRKKPKTTPDADWTIFITSLAGAIEGASSGTTEAIMKAFVTGVAHNNL